MTDEDHEIWARASQYATPRDAALLRILDASRARIATLEVALEDVIGSSWMADDEAFAAVCDKARETLAAPAAPREEGS